MKLFTLKIHKKELMGLVSFTFLIAFSSMLYAPQVRIPQAHAVGDTQGVDFFKLSKVQKAYGDAEVLKVLKVCDGDTFKANLKNYPPIVGEDIGIRINGIDAPEIHDQDPVIKAKAQEAKDYATNRLMSAHKIVLKNIKRDKYFRIDADVLVDGVDLGEELLQAGLALPYDNRTKPDWTEFLRVTKHQKGLYKQKQAH